MECQTLPSTSSLSGASADAPRTLDQQNRPVRRRLPKAAVFILPKRTDRGAEWRSPPSPISLPPTPPPLPLPPPDDDAGGGGGGAAAAAEADAERALVVALDEPPSPLPLPLRGRVRLLSRDSTDDDDDGDADATAVVVAAQPAAPAEPDHVHRAWYRTRASPAQTLCVRGVRHVTPAPPAEHTAIVALSVQAAAAHCAYDEFVSAPKNTMWKRFTRRFKSSFLAPAAPRPSMPTLPN